MARDKQETLEEIDALLQQSYGMLVTRLAAAEEELVRAKAHRDALASRVAAVAAVLDVDVTEVAAPADAVTPAEPEPAPAPATMGRPRGQLWNDVFEILNGHKRAIRVGSLYKKLVDKGYEDNDALRSRLNVSLVRWAKSQRIERSGRGLYRMPKADEVSPEPAAAPAPTRRKRSKPATPDHLWNLVIRLAKFGPVGRSDLLNTLAADGWSVRTQKQKNAVLEQLGAWVEGGTLIEVDPGVYGLPE